jgi:hypothetical protein
MVCGIGDLYMRSLYLLCPQFRTWGQPVVTPIFPLKIRPCVPCCRGLLDQ